MNSLGRVVLVLGLFALAGTTACSKKEPDPATVHREQGDKYLGESKWKEAAAEYEKSLQANPKQEKLWEKKAFAHQQAGEFDEADATILKTLELKGPPSQEEKIEMYRKLASKYLQSGQADRAEKYFLMIAELNPKDDIALGWLAEIYAQRGGARTKNPGKPELLEKSFEFYDKVIALRPDFPNTYFNKRIAIAKYVEAEQTAMQAAETEAEANKKDKAKVAELKTKAAEHLARIEALKKQYEEISAKGMEVMKAWKAAQGQAPSPAAGQAPAQK